MKTEISGVGRQFYRPALLSSSWGRISRLWNFQDLHKCTLTCSLGCAFCTWHFTSSSSVKRKLETIPEGQDLKQSFFFNSSCFLFTQDKIDEIQLMIFDWWCSSQVEKPILKRFKSPLYSFFNKILNFKSQVINGLVSKSCFRAQLRMRSPKFKRHFRGA